MPPARASLAPRRTGTATATTALGAAALRVRWDRVGRVALLLLLATVVLLYVEPARSLYSTWRDAGAKRSQVQTLERRHDALLRRAKALRDPRTVEAEARRLGMVRPGERSYVVRNLPNR